ncbi:PAS domain S-box protein [Methanoregula formicica]|uniref:Diadenylate cyclase n=1 Tax=Methanoregula formicica (strain DSM 22288 / NBRC 105244 / SMSP) TaxID=593750 RepID=L0HHU5_METFS|nr:PAS domain S-box protein [Methanoregula formicica]AGB02644.1 PAS domain S-box [Methanoregula formicica SMSP]
MISILFVDDNTDLFTRIRTFLEKTGDIRIEQAHSIKQATEKLRGRMYDVIISYEQLPEVNGIEFVPDMNGIDFLKYLKSQGNSTPIILLGRRGPNKISLGEVSNATEITLPSTGDLRPQLMEMVTLIKQTMLRRKAEREQKAQTEQLATILSATPLGIFQIRNGIIEWVNRPFVTMLGTDEGALIGKELRTLIRTTEEFDQLAREFQIRKDPEGLAHADCRLVRRDGKTIPCHIQAQALDPQDIVRGGTFVVTDNTEKQKLTDALRESEAKYREVQTNSQSIIIRMDIQGTITFFNTYALTFFDYSAEDVIGKNVVGTIVAEKSRVQHGLSMMASDIGFNAEGYAVNINENIRRNGDRVWIAWINKAIRDEQERLIEILCIGHDITDRKRGSGEVRISTDTWKDMVVADTDIKEEVFDAVFHICTEITIEGREGKPVGTTFLIGDTKNVLEKSRQIILNPFEGHKPELRMVTNPGLNENIKALAQLDGAFVITGDGFIEAVGRYITVDSSNVSLPPGMGTRHNSVAAITAVTNAVGIVVSQSGGGITVFREGRILKKITL